MSMAKLTDARLKVLATGEPWVCLQDEEGTSMATELLALRQAYAELQERYDIDVNPGGK